jgi:hypothetical protein
MDSMTKQWITFYISTIFGVYCALLTASAFNQGFYAICFLTTPLSIISLMFSYEALSCIKEYYEG